MKLHILTRYHQGRFERFKELVSSLSGNFQMHISVEEDSQRQEVLSVIPSARVVKVQKDPKIPACFNGYINILKAGLNEPVWVLDSDDVAFPNAVDNILRHYVPHALNVFTIKYGIRNKLPREHKKYPISSQCLVWNPSEIPIDWVKEYGADNIFFSACKKADIPIVMNGKTPVAWLKQNNSGK